MSSDWLLKGRSDEDYSTDETTSFEESEPPGQTIDSISRSLQRFDWPDYVVFVLMLLICIVIGIFFGYKDHQKHKHRRKQARRESEALDYLVGGRKMQIFPVSVSLVASWISGISLLGTSTEIYVYGTQYCYIVFAVIMMGFVMHHVFLPVFHELQITSAYEGGLKAVVWTDVIQSGVTLLALLAVLIKGTYDVGGPAEVVQRNIAGGRLEAPIFDPDPTLRHSVWIILLGAPVWFCYGVSCSQDMIQRFLALPTLQDARKALKGFVIGWIVVNVIFFLIGMLVYATYYRCDPLTTQLARAKDQLLPLFVMETFAAYPGMTGVFVAGIFSAALSSLSSALNALSAITLEDFFKPYCKKPLTEKQINYIMRGLLVYATYHECDPLTAQLVKAKDQLLPLFVMETFAAYPGMTGVFVAGIFSAALSSLSSALNALSAVTLEDFFKPYCRKPLTEKQTSYIMRGSVLVYGAVTVMLSLLVQHLGTVMQLAMTLSAASAAPLLGMFVMGILMPWVNGTGALYGGITGLLTMFYMCYNAQYSIAAGSRTFDTKPVSVAECGYEVRYNTSIHSIFMDADTPIEQEYPDSELEKMETSIYHISYMYFTLFGMSVTCVAGTVVSLLSNLCGRDRDQPIDPKLLAPCIRKKQSRDIPLTTRSAPSNLK
uniref:Sodium-coupled monocarboxylate transporter 1 n=1 Tax=Anopheles coluzzii TaxID=1518534 RepID=A0A8W7P196_ANOCL